MNTATANTLFNRITSLNKKLNKFQTKQLGQFVKDLYLKEYKTLPEKTVIHLKTKAGEPTARLVAVYPDKFVPSIDKLILKYAAKQEKALKYKESMIASKRQAVKRAKTI